VCKRYCEGTYTCIHCSRFEVDAPRTLCELQRVSCALVKHSRVFVDCVFRIFDLLGSPDVVGEYQIVDDKVRGSIVRGLSVHEVADEEETLNMLFRGEANRTTAEHLLNKDSNRSHCVFTVHISQRTRLGSNAAKVRAHRVCKRVTEALSCLLILFSASDPCFQA
jgi:hypothetical protein